jgi:hypothetical protein
MEFVLNLFIQYSLLSLHEKDEIGMPVIAKHTKDYGKSNFASPFALELAFYWSY